MKEWPKTKVDIIGRKLNGINHTNSTKYTGKTGGRAKSGSQHLLANPDAAKQHRIQQIFQ